MSETKLTKEEDVLLRSMLRGIIAIAAGEQQAAALFDNQQLQSGNVQTVNRMVDYTKNFIRENA
jgi:hypothetical protein